MLEVGSRKRQSTLMRLLVILVVIPLVLAACADNGGDTSDDDASTDDTEETTDDESDAADNGEAAAAEDDETEVAESDDESGDATEEPDSEEPTATDDEGDSEEADDSESESDSAEGPSFDLSGTEVRITGATPDALGMPMYKMLDYLEEWGASVDHIQLTATTGIQALIAGQSDMGGQGSDELILGAAEGADVVAFAVTRHKMDYVLVGNTEIESIEDLEGLSVGMSGPAGFDTLLTRLAVRRSNIPMDSVNFVQIGGSPDRSAALLSGQVDAAVVFISDWNELDAQTEDLHDIVWMADLADSTTKSVILTERSYLDENPELALATACANLEAFSWFDQNREEFIEYTLENVEGSTEEASAATWDQMKEIGMFPPDASELLQVDGVQELADTMYEAGEIQNEVNAEDLVDRSFLDEAASMGCGQ